MHRNKRWIKVLLFAVLLSLGGCFDYHEVEDVSVVSGIGVELVEEELVVHLELLAKGRIPSEGEGIKTITTKGKTFKDAIHNVVLQSGKTPYFGHTQVLIVDESATALLVNILEDLMVQKELRFDMQIVVAYNALKPLFEKQEVLRAFDLLELVQTNRRWGTSVTMSLLDYQIAKKNALVLPMLTMVEEEPTLKEGALYLHQDQMQVLDGTTITSYLILTGLFEHAWYEVVLDEDTTIWGELQRLKPQFILEDERILVKGTFLVNELDQQVAQLAQAQLEEQLRQFLTDNQTLQILDVAQAFQKTKWLEKPFGNQIPKIEVQIKLEAINQTRRGKDA